MVVFRLGGFGVGCEPDFIDLTNQVIALRLQLVEISSNRLVHLQLVSDLKVVIGFRKEIGVGGDLNVIVSINQPRVHSLRLIRAVFNSLVLL